MTKIEFEPLGENSRAAASNALRTVERDTEEAAMRMRALLPMAWLGIFGGRGVTMSLLWKRIEMGVELNFDIEGALDEPLSPNWRGCVRHNLPVGRRPRLLVPAIDRPLQQYRSD
ncbi:MAG: hypothetical protein OXN97_09930 [Bryobacterales bacterium]|nr:hypothetical protein [Bryobacterales bacterium]